MDIENNKRQDVSASVEVPSVAVESDCGSAGIAQTSLSFSGGLNGASAR